MIGMYVLVSVALPLLIKMTAVKTRRFCTGLEATVEQNENPRFFKGKGWASGQDLAPRASVDWQQVADTKQSRAEEALKQKKEATPNVTERPPKQRRHSG